MWRTLTLLLLVALLLTPAEPAKKRKKSKKPNHKKNKKPAAAAKKQATLVANASKDKQGQDGYGALYDYDSNLDPSKDALVKKIIREEFKGEIVKVVGRDEYHGAVKNTLIHGQSNNLVHVDTLQHGENYIFWGFRKVRARARAASCGPAPALAQPSLPI